MDVVFVNRKDHPMNPVRVERSQMIDGDVIHDPQKEASEPKEGSKDWIKQQLTAIGVEFGSSASKAELLELLDGQEKPEE